MRLEGGFKLGGERSEVGVWMWDCFRQSSGVCPHGGVGHGKSPIESCGQIGCAWKAASNWAASARRSASGCGIVSGKARAFARTVALGMGNLLLRVAVRSDAPGRRLQTGRRALGGRRLDVGLFQAKLGRLPARWRWAWEISY